jgi:hypothetical protein
MVSASVSFTRAFRPPCQRTGAPVRDSQWLEAGTCRGGGPLGGFLLHGGTWIALAAAEGADVAAIE